MAAGGVPLPLVVKVQAQILATGRRVAGREEDKEREIPEVTQDEQRRMFDYQNLLVQRSLVRYAETEQELAAQEETELPLDAIRDLDEVDWHQIVLWAGRDVPLPKAGDSTSTDSPASSSAPPEGSTPEPSGSGDETPLEASTTT